MGQTRTRIVVILFTLGFGSTLMSVEAACGGGCDAEKRCDGKNNALITSGKIIPICDAETVRDGAVYHWTTPSGTCTCTLDQSIAGSFWRNCMFDPSKTK